VESINIEPMAMFPIVDLAKRPPLKSWIGFHTLRERDACSCGPLILHLVTSALAGSTTPPGRGKSLSVGSAVRDCNCFPGGSPHKTVPWKRAGSPMAQRGL